MINQSFDIPDFHSHTLPRVDHGSDSVETSLFQLELARKQGITRVLSTPHFYPHVHTVSEFLKSRDKAISQLLPALPEETPQIKLGVEVLLCSGIEKLEGLRSLCFYGSEYLLIELPFFDFSGEYITTIKNLKKMGYKVILAHADRYPPQNIEQLLESGVEMLQLNIFSLSGFFKNKKHFEWIDNGSVVALGTDIHGRDKKAYKKFVDIKNRLGERILNVKEKSDKIWSEISLYP